MSATQEAISYQPCLPSERTNSMVSRAGKQGRGRVSSAPSDGAGKGTACRQVPMAEIGCAGCQVPQLQHAQEKEKKKDCAILVPADGMFKDVFRIQIGISDCLAILPWDSSTCPAAQPHPASSWLLVPS